MNPELFLPGDELEFRNALSWPVWTMVAMSLLGAFGSGWLAAAGGSGPVRLVDGYFLLDATARLFLLLINGIFLGIASYVGYLVHSLPRLRKGIEGRVVIALAFMAAANLSILSNHFLISWLFLELTTLAAAPLIIRPGERASLVASWRYLLFSSGGLSLALLGFACIGRGMEHSGGSAAFFIDSFRAALPSEPWQKIGLALVLLGYGTKLGLAPMYAWLPETYDEAPPAVTALLAAVQFNCAIVCLFRVVQVFRAVHPGVLTLELLALGLFSMAVSAFSIIATKNYQRLIAYASINHAGVIAIGLGIGKTAAYGLVLYVVSNAFIKAILFITAGRIKAHCQTKDLREVSGLINDLPYSGLFLMVGTFALLGLPPFGSFLGELIILSELLRAEYLLVFLAFCVLLTITFVATGRAIFPMIWGQAKSRGSRPAQSLAAAFPKFVYLAALISMGLYLPPTVNALFRQVAVSLGGP